MSHPADTVCITAMYVTTLLPVPTESDPRLVELARLSTQVEADVERRNELIVELHADGWSQRRLAGYVGVSYATIRRIIQRQKDTPT